MSSPRQTLVMEAVALLALILAVARERWAQGVEMELIALTIGLAPLHVARIARLRGVDLRAVGPALLGLEVLALTAAIRYPLAWWGALVGGLATGALGISQIRSDVPTSEVPRHRLELEVIALATLALAAAAVTASLLQGDSLAWLRMALLAPLAVDAFRLRDRAGHSLRRACLAALVAMATTSRHGGGIEEFAVSCSCAAISLFALQAARHSPKEMRRRLVRWGARLAVPVACLLLVEFGMRAVPNPYRDVVLEGGGGWHTPGETYHYTGALLGPRVPPEQEVTFRWSSTGTHDVEHPLQTPPGTRRVLVLGDSYVEGVMVPTEALYHLRLQALLAARSTVPVDVVAVGWSGWGQAQELEYLGREGLAYQPDLVLVEFLPANDVRNNLPALESAADADYWTWTRRLYSSALQSRVLSLAFAADKLDLVVRRLEGRSDSMDLDVFRAEPHDPALWAAAWEATAKQLGEMRALCQARGVQLVVVVFTASFELDSLAEGRPTWPDKGVDLELPVRRVTEICSGLGVPCLALAPRLARLPEAERTRLHMVPYDGHWGPLGHARAAEETARYLLDETRIWRDVLERVDPGR